jgi:cobyrinic acid a,c-diamide synthase
VIRKAIEQSSGIPVVGAIPRQKNGEFPERHMGLTPFHEHPEVDHAISASAAAATKYLDLSGLWEIGSDAPELDVPAVAASTAQFQGTEERAVIGVIRDTAFQFYYPDNLEALEQQGASLREINALHDGTLPDIDALYIGGGFPETQAAELASNESFCRSVKAAADNGLPIYAECGGLIYLGRRLTVNEKSYPMTSVLPIDFVLEQRPQAHGYTVMETGIESPFLGKGVIIKGHEFHYSRLVTSDGLQPMAYQISRGHGIDGKGDGIVYKNVLAAYTHLHALGTPEWSVALVKKAREYRKSRQAA